MAEQFVEWVLRVDVPDPQTRAVIYTQYNAKKPDEAVSDATFVVDDEFDASEFTLWVLANAQWAPVAGLVDYRDYEVVYDK